MSRDYEQLESRTSNVQWRAPLVVWVALAATIICGVGLRSLHLTDVTQRSADETIYTYFASRVADEGTSAIPKLFRQFVNDPATWDYPSPTRLTTVVLDAVSMKMWGTRDAVAGVFVSWLFSGLSLVLLAWIGLRFFNPWIALTAVILMTVSMTEIGMARRAWQDTIFGFFSLLLLYATCRIAENPRCRLCLLSFFCLGSFLLLTKQTGVIIYGLLGLWVCWELAANKRDWTSALLMVAIGLTSIAFSVFVWIIAAGDAGIAFAALERSIHPGGRAIAFAKTVMTSPWYQFIDVLWTINPFAFVMAVVGSVVIVSTWRKTNTAWLRDAYAAKASVVILIGFVAFVGFFPGMQDLRLMSPATGPYCLLAATGTYFLVTLAQRKLSKQLFFAFAVFVVLLGGTSIVGEYRSAMAVISNGLGDLPVMWVREVIH